MDSTRPVSALPSRYIPHSNVPPTDIKAVKHRIRHALAENVLRVHRHPSTNPKVYTGSAGEIIMDIHAFAVLPPKSFESTPTSSLIAEAFHEPHDASRVSFLETSVGPATLLLVRQLRLRQHPESNTHKHARRGKLDAEILEEIELAETWRSAADLLSAAQDVAASEQLDDDGCEVLYGRAGLLYALLLMRSELLVTLAYLAHSGKPKDKVVREIEGLCANEDVKALVDIIIKRGELGATNYRDEIEESEQAKAPPLMWRWHGSRYLGAAHGMVGIVHILLHAPSEIIKPHWEKLLACTEWLIAIQDPLGNWQSQAGRHMPIISGGAAAREASKRLAVDEEHDDALIQWCHGAPGFLMLFSALLRRSGASYSTCPLSPERSSPIVAATKRAAELVYTRGLLRKGTGLCHGVAGSIYALLSVSDALDAIAPPTSEPPHPQPQPRSNPLPRSLSLNHHHPTVSLDPDHAYWLLRATHLADLTTGYRKLTQEGRMATPEHPYSLYEGLAGVCCAWAEVLVRLGAKDGANGNGNDNGEDSSGLSQRRAGMPGYDDLLLLD